MFSKLTGWRGAYRIAAAGIAFSAFVGSAPAQGVSLHFSADRTDALEGEVIHWTVSASFTGYPDPGAYFGGFLGDFDASAPSAGFSMNPVGLMGTDSGTNNTSGASVRNVSVNSLALLGSDDPSNPIPIFAFDVVARNPASDAVLSYTADGRSTVYPNDGLFTPPDAYEPTASTSDGVLVRSVDLGISLVLTPDRAAAGYGESVVWTAALEVEADESFTLEQVSGMLDGSAGLFAPGAPTPLAGGSATLTAIDEDSWAFSCNPGVLSIDGPSTIDLFSFEAPFRAPGTQSFAGEFEAGVGIFGRSTTLAGLGVSSAGSVEGPALPTVTVALAPTTDSVPPGAAGAFRGAVRVSGAPGQEIALNALGGSIFPTTSIVAGVDIEPLAGSLTGINTRFGEVRGFSMSFPGTPVPDGGEVEVFDLLATMRDEVGTVAYAGTGNAVVSVNGIEIGLDAVYESTEAMSIGFDFEFELRLVPRTGSVEQGGRVRVDVIVVVSPDAPRVRSLDLGSNGSAPSRLGSESDLRSPVAGLFENFDTGTGDPLVTDDTFTIGTEIYLGQLTGETFANTFGGTVTFFGDPPLEVPLRSLSVESVPFMVVPREADPFDLSGLPLAVSSLELLDERTLLVGASAPGQPGGEIRVLRVGGLGSPDHLATIFPPAPDADAGFGARLARAGTLIAASGGGATHLFDLSDPAHPVHLSSVPGTEARLETGVGSGLAVVRRADVVGELEVFDIADPAAPASLGAFAPEAESGVPGFSRWAFGGGLVVVSKGVDRLVDPVCCASSGCGNCDRTGFAYGAVYDAATGMKLADLEPMTQFGFLGEFGEVTASSIEIVSDAAFVGYFIDQGAGLTDANTVFVYDLTQPGPIPAVSTIRSPTPFFETPSRFGIAMEADGGHLAIGSTVETDFDDFSEPKGGWFSLYEVGQPASPMLRTAFPGAPWFVDFPDDAFGPNGFGRVFSIEGRTVALADTERGRIVVERLETFYGCNDADLAEPFGAVDLADISAFVDLFLSGSGAANLDPDDLLDLDDIVVFIDAFGAGCP
jgi:hypothetical protein